MQQRREQHAPSVEMKTLTGKTVTPAFTVSRLLKATSSSWLPSGSNGLQFHPKLSEKHGLMPLTTRQMHVPPGRPRKIWNDIVLSDFQQLNIIRPYRHAQNKSAWRDRTWATHT